MKNLFYKFAIGAYVPGISGDLERMIDILEEYQLFSNQNNFKGKLEEKDDAGNVIRYAFKTEGEEKTSYNVFAENIHVRMEVTKTGRIYSVHLKMNGDSWTFNKNENKEYDFSHPQTSELRIYVFYDIPVLDVTRAFGDTFKFGTWNKYVYKTLKNLVSSVDACTDSSKFNNDYKEKLWQQK